MFKSVTITVKRSGTPNYLNFSRSERVKFFLGFPVQYQEYEIRGHFGKREIYIDLKQGGIIPEIPAAITECVQYQNMGFISLYPNGEGYYGETFIHSSTFDGEQWLNVQGLTTADVREALKRFTKGELPPNWESAFARKSLPVVRVQGEVTCTHRDDDYDIFYSR